MWYNVNKIGIFGGTFNPVHKGHEITAVSFYDKIGLDKLIIIPSNIPPHKQIYEKVTPEQRFEMCGICFGQEKYGKYNIDVSDIEIKKNGVSYTVDTLAEIKSVYPDDKIYFLVGSDMLLYLEHWYRYEDLFKMCAFAAAFRNNDKTEREKIFNLCGKFKNLGAEIETLDNEPFEISSTELREKMKNNNLNLEEYISPAVLDYIREKKIYVLQ
jgi:nicotinate-nucleotide adenylyltransferase